jgi:hypothetical protein
MAVGVIVGGLAGYAWRTRWVILLAPLSHAVVVELVRLPLDGPTVEAYGAAVGEGRRVRRVPAPILDPTGAPLEGSIAELTTVELGGHEQTVLLRGHRAEAPVLLYLVGGPGGSQLGHVRATMEGLEEDVVLALWEQRGTGTSYPQLELPGLEGIGTPEYGLVAKRNVVAVRRPLARLVGDARRTGQGTRRPRWHRSRAALPGAGRVPCDDAAHPRRDGRLSSVGPPWRTRTTAVSNPGRPAGARVGGPTGVTAGGTRAPARVLLEGA